MGNNALKMLVENTTEPEQMLVLRNGADVHDVEYFLRHGLLVAVEMDQQAEARIAVAIQIQMPPRKAQRHRAPGVLPLLAVGILGLHMVKGQRHQLTVGHMEIQPAVQTAQPLFTVALPADHQHSHQHHQRHTVQALTLDQAPDARQNARHQNDAVDHVLTQPDLLQLSHARSPFLCFQLCYSITYPSLMQALNPAKNRKFALAFSLFLGIIMADRISANIVIF